MAEYKRNNVDLGCGTLIIIALIVFFLSGRSQTGELKNSIESLKKEVIVLQQKVDALSQDTHKNKVMVAPTSPPEDK
jgi:hypothetical protein